MELKFTHKRLITKCKQQSINFLNISVNNVTFLKLHYMFSLRNTFEKFGKQLDIEKYSQDLEKLDYLKCQEYPLIC